jgi:flagellar biosynthesis/type III secretory pathway protein FliH
MEDKIKEQIKGTVERFFESNHSPTEELVVNILKIVLEQKTSELAQRDQANYRRGYEEGLKDGFDQKDEKTKKDGITCPFCNDTDFDEIGLKHHLTNYCDAIEAIDTL